MADGGPVDLSGLSWRDESIFRSENGRDPKSKRLVRGVKMYLKNMDLKGMPFKKMVVLFLHKANLRKPMIKKKRPETMIERVEEHHMYDNGPKPKHYEDKSIVDMEMEFYDWPTKETPVVVKAKEGPFESVNQNTTS